MTTDSAPPLVTVLMPTHDHVDTLAHSIPTVLAQTHSNLELLVCGDGAPAEAREVVESFALGDKRVSWYDFPKGPRHGEVHRHELLNSRAAGEFVFYLSDDDLWLPHHIESMLESMRAHSANFASCQPLWIMTGDGPHKRWLVDLGLQFYRDELAAGRNRIPLSCGAHTMELYRSLPHGWRTTPAGTPTDLYMWQQLLDHPDCRPCSGDQVTVIGLPDSQRKDLSPEARLEELATWSPALPDTELRALRAALAAEGGVRNHAALESDHAALTTYAQEGTARETALLQQGAAAHEAQRHLAAEIERMRQSRLWQAAERLRRIARPLSRDRLGKP